MALVAVVLAVALVAALANLLPDRESVAPNGNPVTSAVATPVTTPSPEPTRGADAQRRAERERSPAGFRTAAINCSELGAGV